MRSRWVASPLLAVFVPATALFLFFSFAREKLVPWGCDADRAAWRLTGDEPVYLLTAQAIASGHGQNLRPVNEAQTYTNFQSRLVLSPQYGTWEYYRKVGYRPWFDRGHVWGDRQTVHRPPLVSLTIVPVAFLRSGFRWWACLIQSLLAVLAAGVVLWPQEEDPASPRWWPAAAVVAFLGSLPAAYYTCQIFPETVAGVCLLTALRLNESRRAAVRAIGNICLVAALWSTARVVAGIAFATACYAMVALRAKRWAELFVLTMGWGLYVAHNLGLWGHPLPPNPHESNAVRLSYIPKGVLIHFFSNQVGLFFLAPVTVVGLASLILLTVAHRRDPGTAAVWGLFLGTLLIVTSFPKYRAGQCAAGRYQVVSAYILLFATATALGSRAIPTPWLRRVQTALIVLGIPSLLESALVLRWPACWHEKYLPVFKYPRLMLFYDFLPDVHRDRRLWLLAIWVGVFIGSFFLWDLGAWWQRCRLRRCQSPSAKGDTSGHLRSRNRKVP